MTPRVIPLSLGSNAAHSAWCLCTRERRQLNRPHGDKKKKNAPVTAGIAPEHLPRLTVPVLLARHAPRVGNILRVRVFVREEVSFVRVQQVVADVGVGMVHVVVVKLLYTKHDVSTIAHTNINKVTLKTSGILMRFLADSRLTNPPLAQISL
jgi:hypothetical protein